MRARFSIGLVLGGGLLCSLGAAAGTTEQAVAIPLTFEYDSNPLMFSSGAKGVYMGRVAPIYTVSHTEGANRYAATLAATGELSSDQSIISNAVYPRGGLDWTHTGESNTFSLIAGYEQSPARVTDFREFGTVTTTDVKRTTSGLGGRWRGEVSERFSMNAAADYRDIRYSSNTGGLTDYKTMVGEVGGGYAFTGLTDFLFLGNAGRYEPTGSGLDSNYYGMMLGGKHKFSERFDTTLLAGPVVLDGPGTETDWQGRWQLGYGDDRFGVTFEIGRTVVASGVSSGFYMGDQALARVSYALSERSSIAFDGIWTRYRDALSLRNYAETYNVTYDHELSPFWKLVARYQYRQYEQQTISSASGNLVSLSLVYTHPDF